MDQHSYDLDGNPTLPTKRQFADIGDSISKQHRATNTPFNREAWQRAFVRWTVSTNQSLRQAVKKAHFKLLTYQNPRVNDIIPYSHNTARS